MSDSQASLFPPQDPRSSWPFQPTVPLLPCLCVQLFNTLTLQCSSTPSPYLWTPGLQHLKPQSHPALMQSCKIQTSQYCYPKYDTNTQGMG